MSETPNHVFDVRTVPLGGKVLVEASAGTGKTYAIATLVVRFIVERQLSIEQVLVVTFTEAATAELRGRIRQRLKEAETVLSELLSGADEYSGDANLLAILKAIDQKQGARKSVRLALSNFDDASIFTIHGFCHRALNENAFESGIEFEGELLQDPRGLIDLVLLDFWSTELHDAEPEFVEFLSNCTPKISYDKLKGLARYAVSAADYDLVSASGAATPVEPAEYHAAFERVRTLYDRPALEDWFESAPVKSQSYNKRNLPNRLDEFETLASARGKLPKLPKMLEKLGEEFLRSTAKGPIDPPPFFAAVDKLINARKRLDAQLQQSASEFLQRLVSFTSREYERRKTKNNQLSFDDLLLRLAQALNRPPRQSSRGSSQLSASLFRRFPVALIDEFQDTDPVQWSVFSKVYSPEAASLFLVGDPKQAIYSFRGADIFAYLEVARTIPEQRRYSMAVNYRSDPGLIEGVNRLFSKNSQPFWLKDLQYHAVEPREGAAPALQLSGEQPGLSFRFYERSDSGGRAKSVPQEFEAAAAIEVTRLLNSEARLCGRALRPSDFAILTRTNRSAFESKAALSARGVPSVVLGDRSVFEYGEAGELQYLLAAALEPSSFRATRAALTTELIGLNANDLVQLDADEDAWEQWHARFRRYHGLWHHEGFVQMIRALLRECKVPERLLSLGDGERRMTNLLHLIELLHGAAMGQYLGPRSLYQYLKSQRTRGTTSLESEQIRLESDADSVVITTVHKSKGLEYPIVLCPNLSQDILAFSGDLATRYHDGENPSRLKLNVDLARYEQGFTAMETEGLAENLRLLYVAVTRAKHHTVVFWGATSPYSNSALAYLLYADGPPDSGSRKAMAEQISCLGDDQLLAAIEQVAPGAPLAGVAIGSLEQEKENDAEYSRRPNPLGKLGYRSLTDPITLWARTASFSELSSDKGAPAQHATGKDHIDEAVLHTEVLEFPQERDQPCTLADFPGGANTGNFFHAVLEFCDFQQPATSASTEALIADALRKHNLSLDLLSLAATSLDECFECPLKDGFSLGQISPRDRLNELEFFLPVGSGPTGASDASSVGLLTPSNLGQVFRNHPSDAVDPSYPKLVDVLEFAPLHGYLKGFIDLVFRHRNKWYLVDYKTNNLGATYSDYSGNHLRGAMAQHHYILQYHLYTLAVDRFLRFRLPDYTYDRDFGGVLYLFLRGMHKNLPSSGVFFEKPPPARLSALSRLFSTDASVVDRDKLTRGRTIL